MIVAETTQDKENVSKNPSIALCPNVPFNVSKFEEQVSKFWRTDEIGINTAYTQREKANYKHFKNTIQHEDTGKFHCTINISERDTEPWKFVSFMA